MNKSLLQKCFAPSAVTNLLNNTSLQLDDIAGVI